MDIKASLQFSESFDNFRIKMNDNYIFPEKRTQLTLL